MSRLISVLLLLVSAQLHAENTQITISQQQIDNLAIQLGSLAASQQVPLLYAPGKVVAPANREVLVSSNQPGLVVQLTVNIGDSVKQGQVLAHINSPELVSLQQAFLLAGNELNLSGKARQRDEKLWQDGIIPERRWQETQAIQGSKSAQRDAARQLLLMAGMSADEINQLAGSGKLSSQLNLRAPLSGVVLERMASVGARLDMLAPLYRLADVSQLWLEINIPQERMQSVHLGDQVRIEHSAATAKISLLGQSVNPQNQTVLARAVIDGKQAELRVGQNVNVQLMQQQQGYVVPNTALAQNGGRSYLFVRNAEGFAVTEVTVIGKQQDTVVISGALSGQEPIALKGSVALKANWLGLGGDE